MTEQTSEENVTELHNEAEEAKEQEEKTAEQIIEDLKSSNRDLILLSKKQKETIHRASMKINHLERELFVSQNQIDSIGGIMIAAIKRYGKNNQLEMTREEIELIPPGTMISDEEKEDKVYLKVVDVSKQPRVIRGSGGVPMMMGPDGQPIPMQMTPQGPMPVSPGPQSVPSPPQPEEVEEPREGSEESTDEE
ncbi:MAG: hypothetical protein ACTSW7_01365 [Candidatus Thorarchaeota archaeon]|nr:hypothetical protein [Thermoplasmatales archaeon]